MTGAGNQKAKEAHNQTVNQYVALGESRENAENLASLFPDSNPLDILKGKNYNTQNKPIENTIEAKKVRENAPLIEQVNYDLKKAYEGRQKATEKGDLEQVKWFTEKISELEEKKNQLTGR